MREEDLKYLRKAKAKNLCEWYNAPFEKFVPKTEVYSNATILPLRDIPGDYLLFGEGGVLDSNKEYIPLSAIEYQIDRGYMVDETAYEDKKVVYCGFLVNHWGHFLIEAVARLWYFLKNDTTVDKYVFFVEKGVTPPPYPTGNFKEFFDLLGITDKLEIISEPTTYREVIVPEIGYRRMKGWSEEFLEMYDYVSDQAMSNSPEIEKKDKKIFFSRSKFMASEGGNDMLDDLFAKNGYEVISPETISLSTMIRLIRYAEICASVSGTMPHNMLFAKNGQKLQLIERNVLNNEVQVDINRMMHLETEYVDANFAIYTNGPNMLAYNQYMEHFVKDNNMLPCDSRFCTNYYYRKMFADYMENYRKKNGYRWKIDERQFECISLYYEGYKESFPYFKEYLTMKKPYKWSQFFNPLFWRRTMFKSAFDMAFKR